MTGQAGPGRVDRPARNAAGPAAPETGPGERDRPGPFVRGLTVGVLVGAAIAGSRIWRRISGRRRRRSAG